MVGEVKVTMEKRKLMSEKRKLFVCFNYDSITFYSYDHVPQNT